MLVGLEPGVTWDRSEGTSGKVGSGASAATSGWGRKLASEMTGSLVGAVSPGAPMGRATARKGTVNGVLFGLLVIWVFIFQSSSPHGISESRRSSPRAEARRHGPGARIQHKPSRPLPHVCSPSSPQLSTKLPPSQTSTPS